MAMARAKVSARNSAVLAEVKAYLVVIEAKLLVEIKVLATISRRVRLLAEVKELTAVAT